MFTKINTYLKKMFSGFLLGISLFSSQSVADHIDFTLIFIESVSQDIIKTYKNLAPQAFKEKEQEIIQKWFSELKTQEPDQLAIQKDPVQIMLYISYVQLINKTLLDIQKRIDTKQAQLSKELGRELIVTSEPDVDNSRINIIRGLQHETNDYLCQLKEAYPYHTTIHESSYPLLLLANTENFLLNANLIPLFKSDPLSLAIEDRNAFLYYLIKNLSLQNHIAANHDEISGPDQDLLYINMILDRIDDILMIDLEDHVQLLSFFQKSRVILKNHPYKIAEIQARVSEIKKEPDSFSSNYHYSDHRVDTSRRGWLLTYECQPGSLTSYKAEWDTSMSMFESTLTSISIPTSTLLSKLTSKLTSKSTNLTVTVQETRYPSN